jgi:hypothetical protein
VKGTKGVVLFGEKNEPKSPHYEEKEYQKVAIFRK